MNECGKLATIALQKKVWDQLDNALGNDYDMRGWKVDDIIADMLTWSSDFDEGQYHPDAIRPHVKTWIDARRTLQ